MEITLVGATGLVGSEVLKQLHSEDKVSKINVLTRKKINIQSPKVVNYVIDFDKDEDLKNSIHGDAIICCIEQPKQKRQM
jgi:NAD dependent epimerase/dehydratase family enzyme